MSQTEIITNERVFSNVHEFGFLGNYTHTTFMQELDNHNNNREDFIVNPTNSQFSGTNFMVDDRVFQLDSVSLITLSERLKVSGVNTITRTGLFSLSRDPNVFEQAVNLLLQQNNQEIKFRTLFNNGIAFPSARYTIVNNIDVVNTVLGVVNSVTNSQAETRNHYLQKELMYTFIPFEGVNLEFETVEGSREVLKLGVELRNSEILQHAVSVAFKIVRESNGEGILLNSGIKHVYQRHIGRTTGDILSTVENELIEMFSSDAFLEAVEVMNFIKLLLVKNAEETDSEFLQAFSRLLDLKEQDRELFYQIMDLQGTSLYSRTIGAYNRFINNSNSNRIQRETEEGFIGSIILNEDFRGLL